MLAFFICLFFPFLTFAQTDSIQQIPADSLQKITMQPDSVKQDSLNPAAQGISPNSIDAVVHYQALDSLRFDISSQKVFMYKENDITYQDINLKADYVEIEFATNSVFATGLPDSSNTLAGLPVFTMADNTFDSEEMHYNFKSKKGLVKKVITKDNEGYLHGGTVKKLGDNTSNLLDGAYTTCELDHPHFEFRFKKARVIPDNKIVTGPAYLVIEDVPTPLAIPFGMFPNKKGQRSGILIPTWGESTQRGFYFENGGYYFAINDYLDLKLVGDIYTLGSWAVKPAMNYRKRYKYNGNFNALYSINVLGEEGTPSYSRNRDFSIRWTHSQDPKASPTSKFSSNVNIASTQSNKFNPVSSNDYLRNTLQSSINYSKNWSGKYFLNLALNHQQNTITRELNLTLPSVTFNVNQFYPFRPKKVSGKLKWYDNISVNYNVAAENRINTYDSALFSNDLGSKLKNGLKHSLKVSSGSIKILKYLVWSNSLNYTERWYSQAHVKSWHNDSLYLNEGPIAGYVGTDTISGFYAVRDFNFSTSASTTMYGMYAYRKGPVKAIRHVIKPSLSFSMRPDFSTAEWGYYKYYQNEQGKTIKYSPYDDMIYGSAPEGRSGAIGFRLSNNLEMKVRNRQDTITGTKKIVLIEDLSLSTGYDIARDSLNMNKLTISGRTTLFKKLQVNYASSFDPYALDSNGLRINKFEWDVNRKLFRTENHNWRLGIAFKLNSEMFGKNKKPATAVPKERTSTEGTEQELKDINNNPEGFVDWNVPWSLNLSYDFTYNTKYTYRNGYWDYDISKDKQVIQSLTFTGDVNLTPKWKFGFRSGYDFPTKTITYTSLQIHRDLHCWEMSFNWVPYGFQQSWNFSINIKSSLLQDLKLDKKKDFRDSY